MPGFFDQPPPPPTLVRNNAVDGTEEQRENLRQHIVSAFAAGLLSVNQQEDLLNLFEEPALADGFTLLANAVRARLAEDGLTLDDLASSGPTPNN